MKFLLLLLIMSFESRGGSVEVKEFVLDCKKVAGCQNLKNNFESMQLNYSSREQLVGILEEVKQAFSEYKMHYNIHKENKKTKVYLKFEPVGRIEKFTIVTKEKIDFSNISVPQKGDPFSQRDMRLFVDNLKVLLETKGYRTPQIKANKIKKNNLLFIEIIVDVGNIQRVKKIKIIARKNVHQIIAPKFEKFKNRPWDKSNFEVEISHIIQSYQSEGYYFFKLQVIKVLKDINNFVVPVVEVKPGPRLGFDIRGNKILLREDILNKFKQLFSGLGGGIGIFKIKQSIKELYQERGIYYSEIEVLELKSDDPGGREIKNYFIKIREGHKILISKINFQGAQEIKGEYLEKVFLSRGSLLSQRGYLDKRDLINFTQELKQYYFKRGFLFVKVIGPNIRIDAKKKVAGVSFRIREGRQIFWRKFNLIGISDEVKAAIVKGIKNKENAPVNIVDLKDDVNNIEYLLKEYGYYFAQVLNKNSNDIIKYSKDYLNADMNLRISSGEMIYFNDLVIVGLKSTQKEVMEREFSFEKGEKITPSKIQNLKSRLSRLGIFSSVSVYPFLDGISGKRANILISVREKKFGFLELAPGFRSDIGFKLSSSVGYNNLFGKNHTMTLRTQINQRLDFSSFDERRRKKKDQSLEFKGALGYDWPYFISMPVDMSVLFSFSRNKLRSFDADITRGSLIFRKNWMDLISTTIRYQIEHNKQFDTTESKDAESFSIGSITPGITLDLRNRSIAPSSGAVLNLSAELARPYLGSQDGEKDIGYDKIITRNSFYFPYGKNTVFAFSFATGVQKNLEKERSIPSIKIFRLNGVDRIRGFSSNEANRLNIPSLGYPNIDHIDVYDKVYFVNLKLEPRYSFSGSLLLAPFLDAGRIMIDNYRPLDLRVSLGLSLKFITPVGMLNFDYGVKVEREKFLDGTERVKDSFGQFHLTIGSF